MKSIHVYTLLTIIFLNVIVLDAYAVSFKDYTGYMPDWAADIGQNQALSVCNTKVEYDTKDWAWCIEFAGYVTDSFGDKRLVTFTDSSGYIPDWATRMGNNQALGVCNSSIGYETSDWDWCIQFAGYVVDTLSQGADEPQQEEQFNSPETLEQSKMSTSKGKIFSVVVEKVPYDAYVDELYDFSIMPPSNWSANKNIELLGGEGAAIVGFYSDKLNPDYTSNFVIGYMDFGKSNFDLLRIYSDQEVLDSMVGELTSNIKTQTKITDKSIEAYDDGYIVKIQFIQTQEVSDKFLQLKRESIAYVLDTGSVYWLNFAATPEDFEDNVWKFRGAVKTFYVGKVEKLPAPENKPVQSKEESVKNNGGGCLIATAAFGSELAPEVQQLRETRDNVVMNTQSGTAFMIAFNSVYYSFAPTVADWEREYPVFKEIVKATITPLITTLSILNYVNIDSDAEMLGYGISVILLNIGMYFVAPAIVIMRLTRHNK